jgi:hypothetical protein
MYGEVSNEAIIDIKEGHTKSLPNSFVPYCVFSRFGLYLGYGIEGIGW